MLLAEIFFIFSLGVLTWLAIVSIQGFRELKFPPFLQFLNSKRKLFETFCKQLGFEVREGIFDVAVILCAVLFLINLFISFPFNLLMACLLFLIGWLVYQRWLERQERVSQEMIVMAGSLSLAVSAGQDFWAAFSQYCHATPGILTKECSQAFASLKLGKHRENIFDSLVEFFPGTRGFFLAIRAHDAQGLPMSSILLEQSQRLRNARLSAAESRLQRLPVLLLGPLALCIFPNIFIALLGPFLLEFV